MACILRSPTRLCQKRVDFAVAELSFACESLQLLVCVPPHQAWTGCFSDDQGPGSLEPYAGTRSWQPLRQAKGRDDGKFLNCKDWVIGLPCCIDESLHFLQPWLTHRAEWPSTSKTLAGSHMAGLLCSSTNSDALRMRCTAYSRGSSVPGFFQ